MEQMKGVCGIYRITNSVNGKTYIGSSVDVRGRMYKHFAHLRQGVHKNAHLQAAYARDGEDSFVVDLLEQCDKANLLTREQHYLDTHKPEYNILPKAGNSMGYRHTPDGKAKMSEANKGNKRFLGRKHKPETIEKLKAARAGRKLKPEHVARIKESLYGNSHTLGHKLTDEHKAKVAQAAFAMWQDPARRLRRSEETKARWADPVWKAAQAERIRAGKAASRAARGLE